MRGDFVLVAMVPRRVVVRGRGAQHAVRNAILRTPPNWCASSIQGVWIPRPAVVRTVTGEVAATELGWVLSHEHLLSLLPGPGLVLRGDAGSRDDAAFDDARVDAAVTALSGFGSWASEPSWTSVRTATWSRRSWREHGVADQDRGTQRSEHRVRHCHLPGGVQPGLGDPGPHRGTRPALHRRCHQRYRATRIRAGMLGEQPTSEGRITAHELRGLRAAARAHRLTGLALSTHTTHGTMAMEQIDLLEEESAELDRVVIGHMDNHSDLDYIRQSWIAASPSDSTRSANSTGTCAGPHRPSTTWTAVTRSRPSPSPIKPAPGAWPRLWLTAMPVRSCFLRT